MISNKVLLLKIIESGARITLLHDRGLSFSQIALLMDELTRDGCVEMKDCRPVLTEKGKNELQSNMNSLYPRKKDQWILPNENMYDIPISSDTIVLPRRSKMI